MNLQDFIRHNILNEFASVVNQEHQATLILDFIGFPQANRPAFPQNSQTQSYWREVCNLIVNGVLPTGNDLQALLDAALHFFPSNNVFSPFNNTPAATTPPTQNDSFILSIRGRSDPDNVLNSVRLIAPSQNIPAENIRLRYAGNGIILLGINSSDSQAIAAFIQAVQTILQNNQNPVEVNLFTEDPQPYIISRLYVEGADQSRFEIENISSDTLIREIAQAVIQEFFPNMMQNRNGNKPFFVVDRINEDGSSDRLNGEQTLHEANIQEDDTLSISPEATAGNLHPQLHQEALLRVKRQILSYAASHAHFQVAADDDFTPREYLFTFHAPSFAPPPSPDSEPEPINQHQVLLLLPPAFPMQAPEVYWQTPIFHPNIDTRIGKVCLGDLGDRYQPGLDFARLCQLLVDIASYQNYAVSEGYNAEAMAWATSDAGQQAIEARGGQAISQRMGVEERTPKPISIRRLDHE